MEQKTLDEAERLYARAQRERTAAAIQDAIEYHRQICEILPAEDTDRAFTYARRIHEMRTWTAEE